MAKRMKHFTKSLICKLVKAKRFVDDFGRKDLALYCGVRHIGPARLASSQGALNNGSLSSHSNCIKSSAHTDSHGV
jgi:hypothetical protein